RMLSFIHHLDQFFSVTKNPVIINQKLKKYLREIESLKQVVTKPVEFGGLILDLPRKQEMQTVPHIKQENIVSPATIKSNVANDLYSKFLDDIISKKIKTEEILLACYLNDTGRGKLMTGWQEHLEVSNIKAWEEVNGIDNVLSSS